MNAFEQVWKSVTGNPATSFVGKRYTFATFNADGNAVTPAAGGYVVGVAYENNDVDQPMQIVAHGFAFIKLGADLAGGQEITTDANGAAVAITADEKPAGFLVVGGPAGAIGTVLLK